MKFGAGFGLAMLLVAASALAQEGTAPFNCPTEPMGWQAPYWFWWDGPPPPVEHV